MINLYLLRHAIAVERGTPGFNDDSLRPLTAKGKLKMHVNARGLKNLGLTFDLILSSPYLRAKETAAIIISTFLIKPDCLVLTENLTPEAPYNKIIREINSFSKKSLNILLVGHEPHLSGLTSHLLTGSSNVNINLKKGGICYLTCKKICSPGTSLLEWVLAPSQLSKIS